MELLIKSVEIVDPQSPYNGKKKDILVKNGIIEKIASSINSRVKVVEAKDLSVSPGWFDLKVNFCEPGFEYKEDLKSGISAAKSGGFTGAAQSPYLKPITSNRSQVEYLRKCAEAHSFNLFPIGSLTQNAEGKVISEMYDMHLGGAVCFSDFDKEIESGILLKALQYAKPFKGIIISMPIDFSIAGSSYVHESAFSTSLGLKGCPTIAEEIRIKRDLDLLEYSDGQLHFSGVSSAKGVDLIKKAKKEGLKVSADVYLHNLVFNDETILEFDTNKKAFPPARSEKDRKALVKGLKDGTIDAICSNHQPENIENKNVEFEYASYGIAAIECMFPVLQSLDLEPELIIEKLAIGPRRILGINELKIDEGNKASLTLFQKNQSFKLEEEKIKSKSANNPFLNIELKGNVLGVITEDKFELFT